MEFAPIGLVPIGNACDLQMPHFPRWQIGAQLVADVAFHDLTMVDIHLDL